MRTRPVFAPFLLAGTMSALACSPAHAAICGDGANPVVVTATPVAFGLYSPGSPSPTNANGTVTVACTVVAGNTLPSFTAALDAGIAGSFAPRQMDFAGTRLNYNLYTDAAHTIVWGDGTGGTSTQSYDASGAQGQVNFTVYGQMPAGQYVAPGSYADTITVTVSY